MIRKPEVPFFGPLYNEMIVDHGVLPGLVRATAVNASRAKRAMMSAYKTYYEERAKALDCIIDKFKLPTTFEDFVANVFSPSQSGTIIQGNMKVGGMSSSSISVSTNRSDMTTALLDPIPGGQAAAGYWTDEPRPRAHTELGERTRSTLGDTWGDKKQYAADGGSDHLPLRKKMSSSGPAQTHLLAAAGNSASQMNSSGIGHMASGAGFSGVALGNSGGGGVQQQNTFSQIPLSDDEEFPTRKISASEIKSPVQQTLSGGRRPLAAMRQNSGGNPGPPVTRKR